MYKKSDLSSQPGWFVIVFVFFGVFMFLFIKQIKQFRKIYYIKNNVRNYEFWCLGHGIRPPEDQMDFENKWPKTAEPFDKYYDEYVNNKRYLKLRKLQRKSKGNILFNMGIK